MVGALRLYRIASSGFPRRCRFEPTCSTFSLEAVRGHGALRGAALSVARVARCHPWNVGGLDPVPLPRSRR
ncbi:MAG: membrane protein insertion efficiency factor YidD [Actinomycetota bacterium]|nr:membrane protein insertion efficiency factor YidD [Actinomycetota bacterium]